MSNIFPYFKKDLSHSYMVIKGDCPTSDVQFHLKMLKHNSINGLLSMSDESLNGEVNYLYDISAKQSFEKIFETEKMSYDILSLLINNLKALRNTLEDYLLDLKYILIQPEFIFINMERDQFFFCYFPSASIYESDQLSDIQSLFNQILSFIDYNDSQAVSLAFSISRLVQSGDFTLQEFPSCVSFSNDFNQPIPPETCPSENNSLLIPSKEIFNVYVNPSSFWHKAKIYFSGKKFAEVIDDINSGMVIRKIRETYTEGSEKASAPIPEVSGDEIDAQSYNPDIEKSLPSAKAYAYMPTGITAALDTEILSIPCLVGTGIQTGITIQLSCFPFTIGKKADSNDYIINDPTVSRCHCRFYKIGENYFFEDQNSTNGSFINNERADPYTRYPLKYGDLIKLSSQEFYFH